MDTVGSNQEGCGLTRNLLGGNTPAVGTGTWSQVSGPGTATFAANANTPGATATVTAYGTYVLRWTIHNGVCADSTKDITVLYDQAPSIATVGSNQEVCGLTSNLLGGNTPAVGTGTWSQVSGPGTATFAANANTPGATATATAYGTYVFRWTIHNGVCADSTKDITVLYDQAPSIATVGSNQEVCGLTSNLLGGNTPTVGTGTWSQVSGPGTATFAANANTPGATATATAYGTYVFRWTIHNGVCADSTKDITVLYDQAPSIATVGSNQEVCGLTSNLLGGNTPAVGTGTWSQVSGPGTATFAANANTPGATATATAYGTYVFRWTIHNGVCADSTKDITVL